MITMNIRMSSEFDKLHAQVLIELEHLLNAVSF